MSGDPEDLERRITALESQSGEIKTRLEGILKDQTDAKRELAEMRTTRSSMQTELDEVRTQVAKLTNNRETGTVLE